MDESSRSKRGDTREFWEEAIRLWTDSGLSVREGLAGYSPQGVYPHTVTMPEVSQVSSRAVN